MSDKVPYRILPTWLTVEDREVLSQMSHQGNWQVGRQRTGYEKLNIQKMRCAQTVIKHALDQLGRPTRYDAWLLRYPENSSIPEHVDQAAANSCHVRLNALVLAGLGGTCIVGGQELPLSVGDAYVFRPDVTPHSVSLIESGERLVLSVGANVSAEHVERLGIL